MYGCKVLKNKEELSNHAKICPDRIRHCEFCPKESSWKGHFSDLGEHLMNNHSKYSLINGEEKPLNPSFLPHGKTKYFMYDYRFNELFYFYLVYDRQRDMTCYFVVYIGDKKNAKNFVYTLSFYSKSEIPRKIISTEICHDDLISFNEIFDSGVHITLPNTVINRYPNACCTLELFNKCLLKTVAGR